MLLLAFMGAGGLVSCQGTGEGHADGARRTPEALGRLSLDLRGVRPTLAELAAAEDAADTSDAWSDQVDTFLEDPRFGPRVRDVFAGIYLTRQDGYAVSAEDYGVVDAAAFVNAVGDEPLRILGEIAAADLPYTDVVRADWTMADEHLAAAAPVSYPEAGAGWQRVRYTDDRPAAGVLATNGFWWHYTTSNTNANRGRANAVSRVLLCHDYLSRPVTFDRDVDLLDAAAVADALHSSPGCVACHATLDPLASFLYGFQPLPADGPVDVASYHPDRERFWHGLTGVPPAYYGTPGDSLGDLAELIAADPRLTTCVTEQVFGALAGRPAELGDTAALLDHHVAFVEGGLTLRALFTSIVEAEDYRAEGRTRMLSVEQLGSALEDLTTFRFTHRGFDLLGSETYGVRSLADGVDGLFATRPNTLPTPTAVLVQARVTQAAAWHVTAHDRSVGPGAATLFTRIDFSERPETGRAAMVAQLQALRARAHGVRIDADAPEIAEDLDLWAELYALDRDPVAAWAGVLSVLLREPAFLFY